MCTGNVQEYFITNIEYFSNNMGNLAATLYCSLLEHYIYFATLIGDFASVFFIIIIIIFLRNNYNLYY